MIQPMAVVLRDVGYRSANFFSRARTSVMNIIPVRLRSSSLSPSEESPPTSSNKFLTSTAKVTAVIMLIIFGILLVCMQAVWVMKWMSSDKADELCNKQLPIKPAGKTNRPEQSEECVLPAFPEHGIFIITNAPDARPGESFESLKLTVSCLPDYGVLGAETVICVNGFWSDPIPKCVRYCKLDKNPSVDYHCLVTGPVEGTRACNAYEPSGTVVRPECSPNYYADFTLPFMRCIDGKWDYVPVCYPECGRVTAYGVEFMIGGRPAGRGEVPWHVGIYSKNMKPYMQICGGSLVTKSRVISAAHCFWNDVTKQLPASQFAVGAGKIYRPWNNARDMHAQKSDVKQIAISRRFQGAATHFQDDIAVIILESDFITDQFVTPICLSFDYTLNKRKLQPGELGKVAGWGLTAENGKASQMLKVVELPYVEIGQCYTVSPPEFVEYITSDKICAGGNGTALCRGDSGGGLAFAQLERGVDHYYLLGITSTAPSSDDLCNSKAVVTTFTDILSHEYFIREHL